MGLIHTLDIIQVECMSFEFASEEMVDAVIRKATIALRIS